MIQPHTHQSKDVPPQQTILQMISAYWISQAVYVAAKLGIADYLQAEAKHCDELATLTGTDASALYRLMRALASLGIFAEGESGYFQLTPLAVSRISITPGSDGISIDWDYANDIRG